MRSHLELVAQRLETTLDLAEAATEMVEARIRREHPELSDEEVLRRVAVWQATRPGAEHGDAEGRVVSWPRTKR